MDTSIRINTVTNVDLRFELAGLGNRMLAALIDLVLIILLLIAYLTLVVSELPEETGSIFGIIGSVLIASYPFWAELLFKGQTVGKNLMKIRVMKVDGSDMDLVSYFLRWLLFVFEAISFGGVALASIILSKHQQRLGDLAAGTVVVKVKNRVRLEDSGFHEYSFSDTYEPRIPEAKQLSGDDMQTVKEVLNLIDDEKEKGLERFEMAYQARLRLCNRLAIQTNLDDVTFLRQLLSDYTYYQSR
ncbi:MAG: RDD family protein [Bacteroidetes bacterium]|nr:MAG: RDD family protein [Bacteroidota bacterium]